MLFVDPSGYAVTLSPAVTNSHAHKCAGPDSPTSTRFARLVYRFRLSNPLWPYKIIQTPMRKHRGLNFVDRVGPRFELVRMSSEK